MCEWHFTSVIFLPKTHNPSRIMRKTSGKSQLKDILQNNWPVPRDTVKKLKEKKKEILRKCHSKKEPKEIQKQMQCGVLDVTLELKKDIRQKLRTPE